MKRTVMSFVCLCLLAVPVVGQTFLEQLHALPSMPDTGRPRVWLYGGPPGPNPNDPAQVEAARVCGGVFAWALAEKYIKDAIELVRRAGDSTEFGLRVHPWYNYKHPPEYRGPAYYEQIRRDRRTLERAKFWIGDMRLARIEIDSESFKRHTGADRERSNDAMAENHALTLSMIREIYGSDVPVGWYGNSTAAGTNLMLTGAEKTRAASCALYTATQQHKHEALLNKTIAWAHATRHGSITVWTCLGPGYHPADGWLWDLGAPPETSAWLGAYLTRGDHWQVHNIILYGAFDRRATSFRDHLVPFLKALKPNGSRTQSNDSFR